MIQIVGGDFLGIGKFTKKAVRKVNKSVLRPVGKAVGKVARNPIAQALNPALAISAHTLNKAAGGKGTIKGVLGKAVDAGASVATSGVKVPKLGGMIGAATKGLKLPNVTSAMRTQLQMAKGVAKGVAKPFPHKPNLMKPLAKAKPTQLSLDKAKKAFPAAAMLVALNAKKRPVVGSTSSAAAQAKLRALVTPPKAKVSPLAPQRALRTVKVSTPKGPATKPAPSTRARTGWFISTEPADRGHIDFEHTTWAPATPKAP
jgi:hypothetical protein